MDLIHTSHKPMLTIIVIGIIIVEIQNQSFIVFKNTSTHKGLKHPKKNLLKKEIVFLKQKKLHLKDDDKTKNITTIFFKEYFRLNNRGDPQI